MVQRKKSLILVTVLVLPVASFMPSASTANETRRDYPVQPVPFTDVQITDEFWSPRMETNRKVTIPYAFKKCEETGRIDNFANVRGIPAPYSNPKRPDSTFYSQLSSRG